MKRLNKNIIKIISAMAFISVCSFSVINAKEETKIKTEENKLEKESKQDISMDIGYTIDGKNVKENAFFMDDKSKDGDLIYKNDTSAADCMAFYIMLDEFLRQNGIKQTESQKNKLINAVFAPTSTAPLKLGGCTTIFINSSDESKFREGLEKMDFKGINITEEKLLEKQKEVLEKSKRWLNKNKEEVSNITKAIKTGSEKLLNNEMEKANRIDYNQLSVKEKQKDLGYGLDCFKNSVTACEKVIDAVGKLKYENVKGLNTKFNVKNNVLESSNIEIDETVLENLKKELSKKIKPVKN